MIVNWLRKWLNRFLSDQSGFVGFMRDEGDGGGDTANIDAEFKAAAEKPAEGGGEVGEGAEGGETGGEIDLELEGIDDNKVLKFLQKKGLKSDSIDKLTNLEKNLGGLTTKHQDTVKLLKGLRAALGDEYDSVLAQGMRKITGDEDYEGGADSGLQEPEHFKDWKPETKKQIESTMNYYVQKQLPSLVQSVIKGVTRYMDEQSFSRDNPDYEDSREIYDSFMKEHGITSRSPKTLALVKKLISEEAGEALGDLAGNEDGKTGKRKVGTPPPKGGARGAKPPIKLETDAEFEAEFNRRKAAQEKG